LYTQCLASASKPCRGFPLRLRDTSLTLFELFLLLWSCKSTVEWLNNSLCAVQNPSPPSCFSAAQFPLVCLFRPSLISPSRRSAFHSCFFVTRALFPSSLPSRLRPTFPEKISSALVPGLPPPTSSLTSVEEYMMFVFSDCSIFSFFSPPPSWAIEAHDAFNVFLRRFQSFSWSSPPPPSRPFNLLGDDP